MVKLGFVANYHFVTEMDQHECPEPQANRFDWLVPFVVANIELLCNKIASQVTISNIDHLLSGLRWSCKFEDGHYKTEVYVRLEDGATKARPNPSASWQDCIRNLPCVIGVSRQRFWIYGVCVTPPPRALLILGVHGPLSLSLPPSPLFRGWRRASAGGSTDLLLSPKHSWYIVFSVD